MESRVVKGWRTRLHEEIDEARSDALGAGSRSQGARSADQALDFRREPVVANGSAFERRATGASAREARASFAAAEGSERLRLLQFELAEREREAGSRTAAALRMQAWRESQTPERLEQHRQTQIECKRRQRQRVAADPDLRDAARLAKRAYDQANRDAINERRRAYRKANAERLNAAKREKRRRARDASPAEGLGPA